MQRRDRTLHCSSVKPAVRILRRRPACRGRSHAFPGAVRRSLVPGCGVRIAGGLWAALMLGAIAGGCATMHGRSDAWVGRDKMQHFGAGAAIGLGCGVAAREGGASDSGCVAVAMGVTSVFAFAKEWRDQSVTGSGWSWKDVVWGWAGSIAGGLLAAGTE